MKTCPFCADKIPDAALICPHCGTDLAAAAEDAAAQLRAAGSPLLQTVMLIAGYILLARLVNASILYFTVRTLGFWSAILAGAASLAIVGFGVLRAQQSKRFALRLWLLVYGVFVVIYTVTGTVALLGT